MREVYLILADAAVELVPPEIRRHPAVLTNASRRGKSPAEILLDKSIHYPAMKRLKDHEKRGRPDIVHVCLLNAHSSRLNREGLLRVIIHTIRGEVIEIDPMTRIPRNYLRFTGVMEQLLVKGRVPPKGDTVLMRRLGSRLRDEIRNRGIDFVVLLNEGGTLITPRRLAETLAAHERPAFVVGAFPRGDFSEEVYGVVDQVYSLGNMLLDAWYVVSRIIASLEDVVGVWDK
ncbi:16S rRNA methyltransferase [Infirmifilum lucidum]|uniref:Ribosomal RNA small subunit methyltransferase Nep1 n=1 Tax=Infirmifilum lucidum TaxID=2776706 RepID=A0A7L9FGQ8_9CREN|nr:16S rRNA methyltransferase [Infirmifilum lucidum]QOJ78193.1 16S rRNA methyltransferase [Infirmifilum lucidum]